MLVVSGSSEDARRHEEEELQRVLEFSIQHKGGRRNWNECSLASSSGAGDSGPQVITQTSTVSLLLAGTPGKTLAHGFSTRKTLC
jgi:hypothetical protein